MEHVKIGLDIHGVIDAKPELFAKLSKLIVEGGGEVHIITGPPYHKVSKKLEECGITWTHFFSIVSEHERIGTPIQYDEKGNAWLEPYLWDKTKGEYCLKHGIDLHLDDSNQYFYFFKTPCARFYSKNTQRQEKMRLSTPEVTS